MFSLSKPQFSSDSTLSCSLSSTNTNLLALWGRYAFHSYCSCHTDKERRARIKGVGGHLSLSPGPEWAGPRRHGCQWCGCQFKALCNTTALTGREMLTACIINSRNNDGVEDIAKGDPPTPSNDLCSWAEGKQLYVWTRTFPSLCIKWGTAFATEPLTALWNDRGWQHTRIKWNQWHAFLKKRAFQFLKYCDISNFSYFSLFSMISSGFLRTYWSNRCSSFP